MKKAIAILACAILPFAAFAQYTIGSKIEPFALKNIDGKTVSLSDYSNQKGAIIIFTCNHCPFVIAWEDRMIELHNKLAAKGFPVIAINPNDADVVPADSFEKMAERAKEKGYPFVYLHDEKQELFPKFGATRTPEVYVAERTAEGFILRYTGAIDDNHKSADEVTEKYVENAINQILSGKKLSTPQTKALGCTIKVKK
jgi:peroxiredoxin